MRDLAIIIMPIIAMSVIVAVIDIESRLRRMPNTSLCLRIESYGFMIACMTLVVVIYWMSTFWGYLASAIVITILTSIILAYVVFVALDSILTLFGTTLQITMPLRALVYAATLSAIIVSIMIDYRDLNRVLQQIDNAQKLINREESED